MPATPSRIGFITQEYRIAQAGPDAQVEASFGSGARKDTAPQETYFQSDEDAEIVAEERLALLSPTRRLFASTLARSSEAQTLAISPVTPTANVLNDGESYNKTALIGEIAIDYETDTARIKTWG